MVGFGPHLVSAIKRQGVRLLASAPSPGDDAIVTLVHLPERSTYTLGVWIPWRGLVVFERSIDISLEGDAVSGDGVSIVWPLPTKVVISSALLVWTLEVTFTALTEETKAALDVSQAAKRLGSLNARDQIQFPHELLRLEIRVVREYTSPGRNLQYVAGPDDSFVVTGESRFLCIDHDWHATLEVQLPVDAEHVLVRPWARGGGAEGVEGAAEGAGAAIETRSVRLAGAATDAPPRALDTDAAVGAPSPRAALAKVLWEGRHRRFVCLHRDGSLLVGHAARAAGEARDEVHVSDKLHVVVPVAYGAGRFGGAQCYEQSRGGDVFCAAHLTLREVDAELALTPGLRAKVAKAKGFLSSAQGEEIARVVDAALVAQTRGELTLLALTETRHLGQLQRGADDDNDDDAGRGGAARPPVSYSLALLALRSQREPQEDAAGDAARHHYALRCLQLATLLQTAAAVPAQHVALRLVDGGRVFVAIGAHATVRSVADLHWRPLGDAAGLAPAVATADDEPPPHWAAAHLLRGAWLFAQQTPRALLVRVVAAPAALAALDGDVACDAADGALLVRDEAALREEAALLDGGRLLGLRRNARHWRRVALPPPLRAALTATATATALHDARGAWTHQQALLRLRPESGGAARAAAASLPKYFALAAPAAPTAAAEGAEPLLWLFAAGTARWRGLSLALGRGGAQPRVLRQLPSLRDLLRCLDAHPSHGAGAARRRSPRADAAVDALRQPTLCRLSSGSFDGDAPAAAPAAERWQLRWQALCLESVALSAALRADAALLRADSRVAVLALAWFGTHSLVLLTQRRAQRFVELLSREAVAAARVPLAAQAEGLLAPATHRLLPLPPGFSPHTLHVLALPTLHAAAAAAADASPWRSQQHCAVAVRSDADALLFQVAAALQPGAAPAARVVDFAVVDLGAVALARCVSPGAAVRQTALYLPSAPLSDAHEALWRRLRAALPPALGGDARGHALWPVQLLVLDARATLRRVDPFAAGDAGPAAAEVVADDATLSADGGDATHWLSGVLLRHATRGDAAQLRRRHARAALRSVGLFPRFARDAAPPDAVDEALEAPLSLWQPLRVRRAPRRERAGSASLLDSLRRAVLDGDAADADSDADSDADDDGRGGADALHCRLRLPLATPRGAALCSLRGAAADARVVAAQSLDAAAPPATTTLPLPTLALASLLELLCLAAPERAARRVVTPATAADAARLDEALALRLLRLAARRLLALAPAQLARVGAAGDPSAAEAAWLSAPTALLPGATLLEQRLFAEAARASFHRDRGRFESLWRAVAAQSPAIAEHALSRLLRRCEPALARRVFPLGATTLLRLFERSVRAQRLTHAARLLASVAEALGGGDTLPSAAAALLVSATLLAASLRALQLETARDCLRFMARLEALPDRDAAAADDAAADATRSVAELWRALVAALLLRGDAAAALYLASLATHRDAADDATDDGDGDARWATRRVAQLRAASDVAAALRRHAARHDAAAPVDEAPSRAPATSPAADRAAAARREALVATSLRETLLRFAFDPATL
eukprot:gene10969-7806_t